MSERILVVDDQPLARRVLATELEDAGFDVIVACDGREAWERFCADVPDVVITDLVMPRSDGMDLLSRIRAQSEVPVILFSAHGSIETAVAALKGGADDFVSSSDFDVDRLVQMVRDALSPDRSAAAARGFDQRLVGDSASMATARRRLEGLALLRAPVLLVGEPGTGCSTAALALHELGSSAGGAFRRIEAADFDAAAPVASLAAVHIDRVDQLPIGGQAFWCQQLQAAAARGFEAFPRVIASTSEPLTLKVQQGDFDSALSELLSRFEVRMPPLLERLEDIPQLAETLLGRAAERLGRRRARISSASLSFLAELPWPGNVAELAKVLERSLAYSRGREISRRAVEDVVADLSESLASLRASRERRQREALVEALHRTGGNITQAADQLGKSRSAVYRLIGKYGVRLGRGG
jgi:DNA-binding NtrC family response regulator